MDETLVPTGQLHLKSWSQTFREHGIQFVKEDLIRINGMPRARGARLTLSRLFPGFDKLPAERQEALVESVCRRKQHHYQELLWQAEGPSATLRVEPYPGVPRLLGELRAAGWRLAVATASRNALPVLRAAGLHGALDVVVSPDDVLTANPTKKEVFRTAAERLGVDPHGIVAIEDASAGVEAAHLAGLPCAAVATSEPIQALRDAGAEVIVPDPSFLTVELLERVIVDFWEKQIAASSGTRSEQQERVIKEALCCARGVEMGPAAPLAAAAFVCDWQLPGGGALATVKKNPF
jgi:HAD superfamily hydrolase (TIGR01509 family)